MKKGFTIVEVSILFVIFMIVALLVAPLSLDDTRQAKNTSRWRNVQQDFANIFASVNTRQEESDTSFNDSFDEILKNEVQGNIKPYRINFLDGTYPNTTYRFAEYKLTYSDAVVATKLFKPTESGLRGILMYDVNGKNGPNVWGKDVFGFNIYDNHFEPLGKDKTITEQKQDCSKNGTGLYCSNYYLLGGNFD